MPNVKGKMHRWTVRGFWFCHICGHTDQHDVKRWTLRNKNGSTTHDEYEQEDLGEQPCQGIGAKAHEATPMEFCGFYPDGKKVAKKKRTEYVRRTMGF